MWSELTRRSNEQHQKAVHFAAQVSCLLASAGMRDAIVEVVPDEERLELMEGTPWKLDYAVGIAHSSGARRPTVALARSSAKSWSVLFERSFGPQTSWSKAGLIIHDRGGLWTWSPDAVPSVREDAQHPVSLRASIVEVVRILAQQRLGVHVPSESHCCDVAADDDRCPF